MTTSYENLDQGVIMGSSHDEIKRCADLRGGEKSALVSAALVRQLSPFVVGCDPQADNRHFFQRPFGCGLAGAGSSMRVWGPSN